MRAGSIIRRELTNRMGFMHAARKRAVWAAVDAMVSGAKLWLTSVGRYWPGQSRQKHKIKAADRLLGNRLLYAELVRLYAELASVVLAKSSGVVVLVDETELRPDLSALVASIAYDGRGLPLYAMVGSKREVRSQCGRERFLRRIEQILPEGVHPIFVTDADYESPWFAAVRSRGWDYVGRVRNRTKFLYEGEWVECQTLHKLAGPRAKSLGCVPFPRKHPQSKRLVLSRTRRSKARKRLNALRRPGRTRNDRDNERSAREPWLLATSLSCNASRVVDIYALRMQIEENFRDCKNCRWGWGLEQNRSRSAERVEALLFIAAITSILQITAGVAAEAAAIHRHYQANTISNRRVISLFLLGALLYRANDVSTLRSLDIRAALRQMRLAIAGTCPAPDG